MKLFLAALFLGLAPLSVLAEQLPLVAPPLPPPSAIPDVPRGAPYHAGSDGSVEIGGSSNVPLRDYLSSRLDELRTEVLNRLEILEKDNRSLIDERDRQYAQRFDAQQTAVSNALQSAKEAVANALSAAKEAVTKAEEASNKRFDSVNEFRKQLADQAATFLNKDAAEIRFKSVEDRVTNLAAKVDGVAYVNQGSSATWSVVAILIGIVIGIGGIVAGFRRTH